MMVLTADQAAAVRVVHPVLPAQDQQQPHPQVDCTAAAAEVLNLPTKTVQVLVAQLESFGQVLLA
jgi:hypothetical protein